MWIASIFLSNTVKCKDWEGVIEVASSVQQTLEFFANELAQSL